jgi:hypothetical protein
MLAVADDDLGNGRARKTIEVLGLNQEQLRSERGGLLDFLDGLVKAMRFAEYTFNHGAIDDIAAMIRDAAKSDLEFAGFRRDFFRQQNLGQYVSAD